MTHERYLLYGVILVAAGICLFLFLLVRTLRAALDRADQKIYGFYSDPEKMNHLREYWTRIEGSEEDKKLSRLAESLGTHLSWYKKAWPVRQISLNISAPRGTLKTSVTAMLRTLPVSQLCSPGIEMRRFFSDQNVTVLITARTNADKPSYFGTAGCGGHVAPDVWTGVFGEQCDEPDQENLWVLLQLTRHTSDNEVVWFLEQTASRIEKGEVAAGDHDDDSGYAFRAYPATPASI
ncbi:hypothetical protein [Pantoea ananatis]|uniref:hypothetical protein n=1 Tax=Pantoea ananas TaxID=553 RepID=UPI003015BDC5